MRTETVTIPATKGEALLRNVYGFAWNTGAPENVLSTLAFVTATVEREDGSVNTHHVRPGVWYASELRITRAWLTVPGGGVAVFDYATARGERADAIVGPSGLQAPQYEERLLISWPANTTFNQGNAGTDAMGRAQTGLYAVPAALNPPPWTRQVEVFCLNAGSFSVANAALWQVWVVDALTGAAIAMLNHIGAAFYINQGGAAVGLAGTPRYLPVACLGGNITVGQYQSVGSAGFISSPASALRYGLKVELFTGQTTQLQGGALSVYVRYYGAP